MCTAGQSTRSSANARNMTQGVWPPLTAMVKWLMANPNLTAAVIATSNFDQLQENVGAAKQALMSSNDRSTLGPSDGRH